MDKTVDFFSHWYDIWQEESKKFFQQSDNGLREIFSHSLPNQVQAERLYQWIQSLKNNFRLHHKEEMKKSDQDYWKILVDTINEAGDEFYNALLDKIRHKEIIKNTRELYLIWLHCCNEAYQNMLETKLYHNAFAEWMSQTIKLWTAKT